MTKAALARLHRAWNALEERGSVDAEGRDADLQSVTAILDASRRQLIRDALDAAVVMVPDGSAIVGLDVVIRDDGRLASYSLVPPGDGVSVASELAADSPLGMALIGHRPGEQVSVNAPAGERVVEIVDVR
jgi:transcription elongation GreA/GreB family factor